ncbi:MAG TPA: metalloregulator ArsR/SmtB family transcription factor [Aggregatilineales bacterium]|nr:metalloregulator ArsR/SmtB family transcription factor [Anaerolineales bacterium]HRE49022.1 metalloregulator ArsR/SmtB family transcription factor [Aggregatilineales bacterium]
MITRREQSELLEFLKVLADENRLRMVALLNGAERNVGELAALLTISEPTTSHHLGKLRGVGLLNLRTEGNQRFYRLNPAMLKRFKKLIGDMEAVDTSTVVEADQRWVDALDLSEDDKKVLRDYAVEGKLTQIPMKQKKLLAILRWLASRFHAGVFYTEKEVNGLISEVYAEDYVSLRRNLIEFGYLRRERGGKRYWLTGEDETP